MKSNIITVLLLFFISTLFAQQPIADELLIQLKPGVSGKSFFQSLDQQRSFGESLMKHKTVSSMWRIHKLNIDPSRNNAASLLETLTKHPDVEIAGYNFQLEPRAVTPNDVLYSDQWNMEAIGADEVWEFTTGGVTALGDTIVVANLEGCEVFHEDIIDNIWRNPGEIPNNNIDDDNNGYIDDYLGISITNGGDNHLVINPHGTQVTGIIGAKGNNGTGISGVNWNVKLMIVSNTLALDEIIESYQYVYNMRKLYNDTNGAEGAFVVSTNASFGVERVFPDSDPFFPVWCELYDSLGEIGVLNAAATGNPKVDIDEKGDMPTSCSSDYLVAVTDVNQANELRGGYSSVNVDLAAPGSSVTTTNLDDEYGPIGGTSSAAPHIAGGIALLYSIPCESWAQLAKDNPAKTASLMKQFLMEGTSPLISLEGKTVSGGLLNLKSSLDLMQNYCGSFTGPLDVLTVKSNLSAGKITIDYQTPKNSFYKIRVYNTIGQVLHYQTVEPDFFEQKSFDIDVSHFAPGVYFLSIENNENIVGKSFVVYYP